MSQNNRKHTIGAYSVTTKDINDETLREIKLLFPSPDKSFTYSNWHEFMEYCKENEISYLIDRWSKEEQFLASEDSFIEITAPMWVSYIGKKYRDLFEAAKADTASKEAEFFNKYLEGSYVDSMPDLNASYSPQILVKLYT